VNSVFERDLGTPQVSDGTPNLPLSHPDLHSVSRLYIGDAQSARPSSSVSPTRIPPAARIRKTNTNERSSGYGRAF
jgi:hypothetical protein